MTIRDSGRMNQALLISIMFFSFTLASCESWLPDAHRPDMTLGNVIERQELDKIHPGMIMSDITRIIGHPMITDPFHADRWDYIYRYIPGEGEILQSRITLFFKGDSLVSIEDSAYREPTPKNQDDSTDRETVEAVPEPDID